MKLRIICLLVVMAIGIGLAAYHQKLTGGKLILADSPFLDQVDSGWTWWLGASGLALIGGGIVMLVLSLTNPLSLKPTPPKRKKIRTIVRTRLIQQVFIWVNEERTRRLKAVFETTPRS